MNRGRPSALRAREAAVTAAAAQYIYVMQSSLGRAEIARLLDVSQSSVARWCAGLLRNGDVGQVRHRIAHEHSNQSDEARELLFTHAEGLVVCAHEKMPGSMPNIDIEGIILAALASPAITA